MQVDSSAEAMPSSQDDGGVSWRRCHLVVVRAIFNSLGQPTLTLSNSQLKYFGLFQILYIKTTGILKVHYLVFAIMLASLEIWAEGMIL